MPNMRVCHGRRAPFAFYSRTSRTPEPDRQFNLVKDHIAELRKDFYRTVSKVKIYVERNLGFEAEHHHRALHDVPGVEFYVVGIIHSMARHPHVGPQQRDHGAVEHYGAQVDALLVFDHADASDELRVVHHDALVGVELVVLEVHFVHAGASRCP